MSEPQESEERSLINTRWQRTLEVLSVIGPPLTVATALLVYFGWARTDAQAKAMGLDVSLFGYTVQDFILRSIQSLFQPLAWLVVIGLLWLILDRAVSRLLDSADHRTLIRRTATVVTVLGFAYAAVMWTVIVARPGQIVLYAPFLIAAGLVVGAWGLSVRRRAVEPAGRALRITPRALERALVFTLVTLLLFWGTSDYAQALGRGAAVDYQERSGLLPTAVVYSKERLAVTVPNVREDSVGTETAPLFRYTGLRLLVVSGGRIFLLNEGWNLAQGRVVVLPDDGSVRVEYGNASAD
ncbi:hypothetical protein SAMN04487917_103322 [Arthrobacter sp. yr096]|uniref:hypothetical protein n=1 Tax=unclassified Arthrobacter TaxID=235627 RepID=UPI00089C90E9|nr:MULTISPECIES: hypothetical protein [unclassified Arthrobacter]SDW56089.1 hypothetical protein SAMN04487912_103361 [Arthrobacter sp. cf158]SEJ01264.1 hypothetical protein SAMN04487917_103322 [Arthrobacter sp. yr096]